MKPEKMFWYKFYIQDYQRDTGHLSFVEHGAYRLLIDRCFQAEGILPPSLGAIYRLTCAMSKGEQAAIRSVIDQFFVLTSDGYVQKRISKEIAQLNLAGSASRQNGASGGRPKGSRKENNKEPENNLAGFEEETCQVSESEPRTNLDPNPDPNLDITLVISHKTEEKNLQSYNARAREGSFPISPSWEPGPDFWILAKRSGHTAESPDYTDALTDFIAYWLTNPGESRTQSQWEKSFLASWKNYRSHASESPAKIRGTSPPRLSPHNDFDKRDYTAGINPDGSF